MTRRSPVPAGCSPPQAKTSGAAARLDAIVGAYVRLYQHRAEAEFSFFRRCRGIARAIEFAALSMLPNRKRHPHQRRIPAAALAEAERNLQGCAAELRRCGDFASLHALVSREIAAIPRIGSLTIYDVSTRIGAHLGLEPDRVYLHAGTAEGARAIGLGQGRETLAIEELPEPFRRLRPAEIEDVLCIFKRALSQRRP